jgi:hypothetical protein
MQMSDDRDLNAIFDRIANRNATDGDIQTLRQSVAIGGNAQDATIEDVDCRWRHLIRWLKS